MKFELNSQKNYNRIGPTYVLIPQVAEDVLVVAWVSDEPSLEERDVEDGGVEVDELEEEHLKRQVVVELGLGTMHL